MYTMMGGEKDAFHGLVNSRGRLNTQLFTRFSDETDLVYCNGLRNLRLWEGAGSEWFTTLVYSAGAELFLQNRYGF